MKLEAYLERHKLSAEAFADLVGVQRYTVQRWARGEQTPPPQYIEAVHEATKGAVGPKDWFDLPAKVK